MGLVGVAVAALLDELHDKKKAIWKYLPVSKSTYSLVHCPDEVKTFLQGLVTMNEYCESALGGVTQWMKSGGWIGIAAAAAQSNMRRNGYLVRPKKKQFNIKGGKRIEKQEGLVYVGQ